MHPRNRNRERYDLNALTTSNPELKEHITPNKMGEASVDFSNPLAVKLLNRALLNHYYGIENWDFPDENLCPPIPGRADYIHYIADVLAENNFGTIPTGEKVTCLDVGVGASCIYPLIGVVEYGWKFIAADIHPKSLASSQHIVDSNPLLKGKIDCRLQENAKDVFYGVITKEEPVDFVLCNPPFHASLEEAQKGTKRKAKNLSPTKNFNLAGISNELVCDGGEAKFIQNMIRESERFATSCFWFSTLVSKQSNLKAIHTLLEHTPATQVKEITMGTSNKASRIVAWTFLTKEEQKEWRETRWMEKA